MTDVSPTPDHAHPKPVHPTRRAGLLALAGIATGLFNPAGAGLARAGAFPEKPVRLLIGYGPGSSTDVVGRIMAQGLAELWKQPVVVENRGGAAGNLAADQASKSAGDGYTLLFAQNGLAISAAANPALPFNAQKDLIALAGVAGTPHILVVHPSSPYKSVGDLIAAAKARPDALNFGSSGIGNSDHMAGELFKALAGVQAVHVPYKSGALAATDLIGGQLDFYFAGMPVGLPQARSGRLRALAVTSTARFEGAPELPTLQEAGVKGYEMTLWQGFFVPGSMPAPVAEVIGAAVARLLDDPVIRDRLAKAGAQVAPLSRAKFTELYLGDIERWKRVIAQQGIKLQ